MNVVIVNTGIGNFGSILNALHRLGAAGSVSADPHTIGRASHLILPGVGSFDAALRNLDQNGVLSVLHCRVLEDRVPTLGICLGLQLLGATSEEGSKPGLRWLSGRTIRFRRSGTANDLKIPHIGWASLDIRRPSVAFDGLGGSSRFYFVHSFHYEDADDGDIAATATYGYPFAAVVQRDNIIGTQFHPECSGRSGLRFLGNFVGRRWNG